MTELFLSFTGLAMTIAVMVWGRKKWAETGHEYWVLAILANLLLMLVMGYWLNVSVHEVLL